MDNGSKDVLLSVRNLRKHFPIRGGIFSSHIGDVRAVDGISFDIHKSETVGLVGESGCGKTTAGRVILRLIEPTSGHTYYRPSPEVMERLKVLYGALDGTPADGEEGRKPSPNSVEALKELDGIANKYSIYRMSGKRLQALRGKLQIVFQDPFSSLSPRLLVRDIVAEPLEIHHMGTRAERYKRVAELLQAVGLNPDHLWRFPHEFSGGQRQRIGIARALALRPDFIVLDEPTSALDVSVQAQILNILKRLQVEQELSYLFISHHLSVVRAVSHRVVVMYLGKMAESAPTEELFNRPLHPYTQALLAAIPIPDPDHHRERIILSGDVPSPAAPPPGCCFHTRCPVVMPICSKVDPPLLEVRPDHIVACHLYPKAIGPGDSALPMASVGSSPLGSMTSPGGASAPPAS
jgi:peptide/nickel transport system ATP-binding protein/oligopeptide transport system ATP-binding protein